MEEFVVIMVLSALLGQETREFFPGNRVERLKSTENLGLPSVYKAGTIYGTEKVKFTQYDTGHNNIIGFAYAYPPEITPTVTVMKGGIGQNFIKVYVSAHEKNDKKTPVKINMEFAIWVEGYDQISLDQMRRMKASAAITSLSLLLGQTTREFTETYNTYYEGETNGLPTVFTTKTIDGKWEVDFKKGATGHNNIIGYGYAYPPGIAPTVTIAGGKIGRNHIKLQISAHGKNSMASKKTPVEINMELAIWVEGYDQKSIDQMRRMKASTAITVLSIFHSQNTPEFTREYRTVRLQPTLRLGFPSVFKVATIHGKRQVEFTKEDTDHRNIIEVAYAYPTGITPTVTVRKGHIGQNHIMLEVNAETKDPKTQQKIPVDIIMEFAVWVKGYEQIGYD